jgi:hypothetical protein
MLLQYSETNYTVLNLLHKPNKLVLAVRLLTSIREVQGSNFGRGIVCPDSLVIFLSSLKNAGPGL